MILGQEMLITTEKPPGLAAVPGQSGGTWAADAIFYTVPGVKYTVVSSFSYIGYRGIGNRFCSSESPVFRNRYIDKETGTFFSSKSLFLALHPEKTTAVHVSNDFLQIL